MKSKKAKLVSIKLRGRASAWWGQLQVQTVRKCKGKIQEWFKMKQKLQKQFLPFNYLYASYLQNDSWQTKNDKGNAAGCFSVNAEPDSSNAAITCKPNTSNGIFTLQILDNTLMMEGIEKEGIVLILDNTLLAPKEDMLMNAPMYDQYKKKKK